MIQYQNDHVTIFQSALYQTTSTVLQTPDFVLLVDPNWLPHEVEAIREHVREMRGDRPLYLIFTHSDFDHIIGYRAFPDAQIIASQIFNEHPEKDHAIDMIHQFDDRYYLKRDYAIDYPTVDHIITTDGQQLVIGDTTLTFYLAGGHTPDGLFTIVEPMGVFIAGDYLSDIEFPYIYHSCRIYEDTMVKVDTILKKHAPTLLIPGHGQCTTDQDEMQRRQQSSLAYIERMKQAIHDDNQEEITRTLQEYSFPRGMKQYHEQNQMIIKQETEQAK